MSTDLNGDPSNAYHWRLQRFPELTKLSCRLEWERGRARYADKQYKDKPDELHPTGLRTR